jgi:outer membrane beta-barrel protein
MKPPRPAPRLLLLAALAVAPLLPAQAQSTRAPANEQVVVPEVERRELALPRYPSNDFEIGLFTGTYSTENFGASLVSGVRLGYHITEDVFVEATYGRTQVSDESFRQVLPGGVFADEEESLSYYNLSAGYNVLPGEVFWRRDTAKATALYLIGGVGSTSFNDQRQQTFNLGFGLRVFMADWAALRLDVRDHVFSMDLLGKRQSTQNIELTAGVSVFF